MKKLLAILTALMMILSLAPVVAEENQSASALGYIMYANADWSAQYWGTDDSAVKAENVQVNGEGDYTVALDFTALEGGASAGLAFLAIGINDGETLFPNYYIRLNAIRVNGEAIEAGKGYTSSDDGVVTRMNLYNEWVTEIPAEARSFDGKTDDASPMVVDKAAFESVERIEIDFSLLKNGIDTAYIMYANADWSAQYWGTDDSAVQASNAQINGFGDYSVALDFTALEGGASAGLAFMALGIVNGEKTYPGAYLKINEIRVNGEAVEFAKGYTSSDDGVTTRMNVYNEWVSELPQDARSFDGNTADAAAIIVDKAAFDAVSKVEIDFSLLPVTDTAFIMYANSDWSAQYWGSDDSAVKATNAVVEGAGTYTVGLDFTALEGGASAGLAFMGVGVQNGEKTFGGYFIDVTEVKVNGEAIELGKGYTTSDDGVTTRENLYNEWVGEELPAEARRKDGDLEGASAIIVDKDAFESVKTVEVTFNYIYGVPAAKDDGTLTEEEAAELCAANYNAYIGLQCKDNYTFRNAWNDSYGRDDENNPGYFTRLTGWNGNDAVDYGGTFADAVLTAEGTYEVSVTLGEMGLGETDAFNLLFVSTDIPSALVSGGYVTISDVKTKIGDQSTKDYTEVDTSGTYAMIKVIDTYNQSSEPFGYTLPKAEETVTITFTVTGLTE